MRSLWELLPAWGGGVGARVRPCLAASADTKATVADYGSALILRCFLGVGLVAAGIYARSWEMRTCARIRKRSSL